MRAALSAISLLILLSCFSACGDFSTEPPIPVREARAINDGVMDALRSEVDYAHLQGYLDSGDRAYVNPLGTGTVTGLVTKDANKTTTRATMGMLLYPIQVGTSAYLATGTLNYDDTHYVNEERSTTYSGTFTLADEEEESWNFRWPSLRYEKLFASSDDNDQVHYRISGSFIINGVTYSYPREQ